MYRWSRLNVCNNFLLSLLHHTDPMCVVKDLHHYFHNKVIKFPDLVCVYDFSKLFFLVNIYFPYNICLTLAAKRAKGKGKKKKNYNKTFSILSFLVGKELPLFFWITMITIPRNLKARICIQPHKLPRLKESTHSKFHYIIKVKKKKTLKNNNKRGNTIASCSVLTLHVDSL